MAERKPAKAAPTKFSEDERAAMRDHAEELKRAASRGSKASAADEEADVLEKIAQMREPDRGMAERLHAIVKASAPALASRTWYGMPAYAKGGDLICFFKPAQKFRTRYATLGFSDKANLDDGDMWPNSYALRELTPEVEKRIGALIKQAAS